MATIAIAMPRLGMTMEEGTIVAWPVAIGARVEKGECVLVIETEKAESEIEASAAGCFRHAYAQAGETLACGALLGALSEAADEPFDAAAFAAAYVPPRSAPASAPAPAAAPAPGSAGPRATAGAWRSRGVAPAARALARQLGVDPAAVAGSGPGGRITRRDVEAFAAARERCVTVAAGVQLEVLRQGAGDPLVLLPGFGSDVSSFALQIPALADSFELIAVNPRGVGLSSAPEAEAYEIAQAAEDVAAVIDAPAHLVGASLGAAVAIELALARPERVRSLSLITPFVELTPRLEAVLQAWCALAAEASSETLGRALAPWLFGDALLGDEARRERTLRGLAASLRRSSAASLRRSAAGLRAWSGRRTMALAGIRAPTLVLVAGADLLTPAGEALAASIPGARCVVVPGAGHALAIDAAELVNAALLEHLCD